MSDQFNPNDISVPNGNYFALPHTPEQSEVVLISVPWDVTTSYRPGTSAAPDAIIDASGQVDLHDFHNEHGYTRGIGTLPIDETIIEQNALLRRDAEKVIKHLEDGGSTEDEYVKNKIKRVNKASEDVNKYVFETAKEWLNKDKKVALVGGDHSTPYGLIMATAQKNGEIGILHVDAHADLREAYEGFKYSHASIMYNVINDIEQVVSLVQVGIRDTCNDEVVMVRENSKIESFYDHTINEARFRGETWHNICQRIIEKLPQKVYVSFDIDGLSPEYCPSTGTPVPGGLSYNEAVYLLKSIPESGREVVGFDLTEVAPSETTGDDWDANVGARLLFKLCNITLKNNQ